MDRLSRITVVKGDDKTLELVFYTDSTKTTRLNITGSTVFFTVKRKLEDADDDALIAVNVTVHTNPTQGETVVRLNNTITDDILGAFKYDIQIKQSNGDITTVDRGNIDFVWQVTERTS